MRSTSTDNYELQLLLEQLKSKAVSSRLWRRVARDLSKPARQRRTVNVYKISRYARDGETILVPGKVLSVGEIGKKVDVAAFQFSAEAKRKIEQAKGRVITIQTLLQENPEGKKVRILG